MSEVVWQCLVTLHWCTSKKSKKKGGGLRCWVLGLRSSLYRHPIAVGFIYFGVTVYWKLKDGSDGVCNQCKDIFLLFFATFKDYIAPSHICLRAFVCSLQVSDTLCLFVNSEHGMGQLPLEIRD